MLFENHSEISCLEAGCFLLENEIDFLARMNWSEISQFEKIDDDINL